MQLKKYFSVTLLSSLCISVFLLLTACSNNSEMNSDDKKPVSTKKVIEKLEHSHPSNPCTDAITHSHSYKIKDHQHSYDCENTNEYVKNGHIHSAEGKYPKRRHVHPNGANQHSHNRE